MKKLYYLIVIVLISSLVLTGCSVLSDISQVPATGQSEVSSLTKDDLNFDVDCPAAPAVAGLLLEAAGIDNRWGSGKDGGNYIKEVANHMGPETDFDTVEKCDIENYRLAVAKFLFGQGATELFAVLESVVYEGMCNTFGTQAGETMTFTFSNDVVLRPDLIPHATPIVYFDVVSAIGTGPLNWTAEGNEVVITTTGTFNNPRPDVGDMVTGLAGIVDDVNGLPVIVSDGGVKIGGIVTYPTTEYSGTFTSTRDIPGEWSYDVTIVRDCNEGEIVWAEITLTDPYSTVIETNVEDVKEDYAYWLQWNIQPNLAAVGTAIYGSFEGNFMFLFADSYIQMLLSTESYDVAWNSNGVWDSGERDYDIWSSGGSFWQ